ncbi:MAG: LytR/AlgR family response regulator transcription factor [Lewinella sp.]
MLTILIDDEPAAIIELQALLRKKHPNLTVAGSANNILDGLQKIETLKPDLIFLDIQMPGGSGFDLIRQLKKGNRPEIIFVTSQSNYAIQAFSCAALGYVLKPVEQKPLAEAITVAEERIRQKNNEQRLETLLKNLKTSDTSKQQIGIPHDRGVEFVPAGSIIYCEGVERYTRIHLKDNGTRLSSYAIGQYRKMLVDHDFYPIHRSILVNRRYVKGINRAGQLELTTHQKLTVSRRRRAEVEAWLKAGR